MAKFDMDFLINKRGFTQEEINEAIHCISCSYLLNSLANGFVETAMDIMQKHNMNIHRVACATSMLRKAFDNYNKEMMSEYGFGRGAITKDYENLESIILQFCNEDDTEQWNWQMRYYMMVKLYEDLKNKTNQ